MSNINKQIHEWKVLTRKNLLSKADEKTVVKTQYLKTFRERKYVEEWVNEHGDPLMVYLTEHWINGKRVCSIHSRSICDWCNLSVEDEKSWMDKWCYNEKKKQWHRSNYVHKSEKL